MNFFNYLCLCLTEAWAHALVHALVPQWVLPHWGIVWHHPNVHVTALCRVCYFHLRSLRHIRRSPMDDIAISIAVALVHSCLDYCNSLLFGISLFNLVKLQRVQNLAARLALNDWHSSIQHIFVKLHWLPIHSRIIFNIPQRLSSFYP